MRSCTAFLVFCVALGACSSKRAGRDAAADARDAGPPAPLSVELPPAPDGWRVRATLRAAADPSAAVVLVHQLGSSHTEWGPLVERLSAGRAVTVLAVDLRGHGASTRGPRNERVTWESFGDDRERWAAMALDVAMAVQYLRQGGARRVAIVASSIGASAAMLAATGNFGEHEPPMQCEVDALAMLSPGLAYHGLEIRDAAQAYVASRRPLFMLAGGADVQSAEATSVLAPMALQSVEVEVIEGASQHGVSLCNAAQERWSRLERWIRSTLGVLEVPSVAVADAGIVRTDVTTVDTAVAAVDVVVTDVPRDAVDHRAARRKRR